VNRDLRETEKFAKALSVQWEAGPICASGPGRAAVQEVQLKEESFYVA